MRGKPPTPRRRYEVEITGPLSQALVTESDRLCRRILNGDFDEDLEHVLEAAHHRKRELREKRYGA